MLPTSGAEDCGVSDEPRVAPCGIGTRLPCKSVIMLSESSPALPNVAPCGMGTRLPCKSVIMLSALLSGIFVPHYLAVHINRGLVAQRLHPKRLQRCSGFVIVEP